MLQEFDLPLGVTLIGRGGSCHITIDDPLVSRVHAKLFVTENEVTIEDLGSRNGTTVNGEEVKGVTLLSSGDRFRLGAQEIFFSLRKDMAQLDGRLTKVSSQCAVCKTVYSIDSMFCPHCGSSDVVGDDMETAPFAEGEAGSPWRLSLILETLEHALAASRIPDAERVLHRLNSELHERQSSVFSEVDLGQDLAVRIASAGLHYVKLSENPFWANWSLRFIHDWSLEKHSKLGESISELLSKYPDMPLRPEDASDKGTEFK